MTDTATFRATAAAAAPDSYVARAASLLREHAAYFREVDTRLALQGSTTHAAFHRDRPSARPPAPPRSRQLALPLRTTMRR
jgi:hypothetical protein